MNHKRKVLIFIVTYNAENTVTSVLNRLPQCLFSDPRFHCEVLIIDDSSKDKTFSVSQNWAKESSQLPLTVLKNPVNQGYGGNQKLGYHYALENGFDVVALLHGDGQYAPEELPCLLEPLLNDECSAVFGSRMIENAAALRGGMPLYKFLGNKVLTFLENSIVGTKLSEYHSGYRLYACSALARIPFELNSNYFDFDTEIIIQLHAAGLSIKELPIPTFYGKEICYVNGLSYALKIIWSCLLYRAQELGIFYKRKFDLGEENYHYQAKFDFLSSHSLGLASVSANERLLLLGSGPAELVQPFSEKGAVVTAVDKYSNAKLASVCKETIGRDLNDFNFQLELSKQQYDKVLALDIIEHLHSPETFLKNIRQAEATAGARLVLTTPNIAFLPLRLMLLLGFFNYGKRGILDYTHTRLFSFNSLCRLLEEQGYKVLCLKGIPAPFPIAFGNTFLSRFLLQLNSLCIRLAKSLFAYQIYLEATPYPTVKQLLEHAIRCSSQEAARLEQDEVGKS